MRRDEYERSYGRRSHVPPHLPSPQEDPRSRRSRTKMKCLISIGLILPALAAVIGVAAWAVSADVVMNSGNNRGSNRVENNLLQNYGLDNDNRPDIFRMNGDRQGFQPRPREIPTTSTTSTTTTSTSTTTTTTTTTTTPAPPSPVPQTLSPKEATDVNAILSKLISASGVASGGSGPRFVVVAPLPDNPEALKSSNAQQPGIERVDRVPTNNERPNESVRFHEDSKDHDLSFSASSQTAKVVAPPPQPLPPKVTNFTNRMSSLSNEHSNRLIAANKEANRRISEKPAMMNSPNNRRGGFNPPTIELTGFEPFDSMMQSESLMASPSVHHLSHDSPPAEFSVGHGTFKRGPPPSQFGARNPMPAQHFDHNKDQHIFIPRPDHSVHTFKAQHPPTRISPGIGMKPIQQQLHHVESNAGPLQTAESNRWGTIGFPPSGAYVHKPPEGISLSISSPANNAAHVSSEPVSVIKSFFLPFLPKPRLNMNARVVFGVVLDKGMGLGSKKESHHIG